MALRQCLQARIHHTCYTVHVRTIIPTVPGLWAIDEWNGKQYKEVCGKLWKGKTLYNICELNEMLSTPSIENQEENELWRGENIYVQRELRTIGIGSSSEKVKAMLLWNVFLSQLRWIRMRLLPIVLSGEIRLTKTNSH